MQSSGYSSVQWHIIDWLYIFWWFLVSFLRVVVVVVAIVAIVAVVLQVDDETPKISHCPWLFSFCYSELRTLWYPPNLVKEVLLLFACALLALALALACGGCCWCGVVVLVLLVLLNSCWNKRMEKHEKKSTKMQETSKHQKCVPKILI